MSNNPMDMAPVCEVCGKDPNECQCPLCPVCGIVGDPACFDRHLYPLVLHSVYRIWKDESGPVDHNLGLLRAIRDYTEPLIKALEFEVSCRE